MAARFQPALSQLASRHNVGGKRVFDQQPSFLRQKSAITCEKICFLWHMVAVMKIV
jgi:hypothetical protein